MGYKMIIEDGVDFSTTLINKTTISKKKSSVWEPLRVCVGETNCRGTYSTRKTMRLTSKNLILNNLILEYYQFWEIRILILLVEEFPDRIVTYNLDFRGFWVSKGETTIFQKKQKCIFEFNCPKTKMSRWGNGNPPY